MTQTLEPNGRKVTIPTGLFINNEWKESKQKAWFDVENPATGTELISVVEGREDDVDEAVAVARKVFDEGSWSE